MSFLGFPRVIQGQKLLNRVCSAAFIRCGIASKQAASKKPASKKPASKKPASRKPEHAKRPPGPYALFASEHYQRTRNENPQSKAQDIFGLMAKKWKNLSDAEKEKYKTDSEQKIADFNAPFLKIPRRPPTPFASFVRDNFAAVERENPGEGAPGVVKIIADKWKELPEDGKERLKEAYVEGKHAYEQRVLEFGENLSEEEREFLEFFKGKKMHQLYKERLKLLDFPKRPAVSSFATFLRMEKDKFPRDSDEKVTEWVTRMAGTWKKMSEKEKDVYREESKRAVEEYGENVLDWQSKHKL